MSKQDSAKFGFSIRCLGLVTLLLATSSVQAQEDDDEVNCVPRPADIVFVIDGSRSVRPWHFKSTTDAVKDMVDQFQSIGPESIQLGLIQYGSIVKQEFALGQFETKEEINEAIDGISYMAGGTMTGAALRYLVTRTFTKQQGARMRPDVAQIAIIITDGRAQDGRDVEIWQRKVKEAGIEVFAIGVGRRIDDEDLLLMASEPKEKHRFYVQNFDLIQNIYLLLKDQLCVEEINECTDAVHGCDHICQNTIGSYYCECRTGFQLQEDGRTCRSLKPPSPVDLSFSEITHTSMRVTWQLDEPEQASNVEYYTVTYQASDGSGEEREMRVLEPEALLEGLTPGTEYTVSVTSHKGVTMAGPLTGSETTLFLGETRVMLSNPTLTSLFATWDPAGGDLLSGYIILVQMIGEDGQVSEVRRVEVSSDVHEMSIGELEPGQSYRVTVTPMHGKLPGGAGSDDGMTLSLKAPDVLVTDTTYKSAVVEWTGIGGAADYFTVQIFPSDSVDGDEFSKVQNVSGEAHSVVFTGLQPATEYTAIVVGHVGVFSSPEGNAEGMTQTPQTPSVTVTETGLTTMDVIWTVSGRSPDYYEVQYYPTDDYENMESVETEDISLKMQNLNPGTEYTINVVAVYEEDGKIRSNKGFTTATTLSVPSPRVQITGTGLTTLDAVWTVDGRQPNDYQVEIYKFGDEGYIQSFTATEPSMSFTNLIPGTRYIVRVRGVYQTESDVVGEAVSQFGTAQDKTKPAPVPEVEITGSGLTTLDAVWTFDALEADSFIVTVRDADGSEVKRFDMQGYSTTISGLQPGTDYTVSVAASYQAAGESFTTGEGSADGTTKSPPAPEVQITSTGVTTVVATWSVVGLQPNSYEVEIYKVGDEENAQSFTTTFSTMSFTGLIPGTRYIVRVRGLYQTEDVGDIVSQPGLDKGKTKPAPVPEVEITGSGLTTLDAVWTFEDVEAESFIVTVRGSDGSEVKRFTTDGYSATITGLEPATDYTVSVAASFQAGGENFTTEEGSADGSTKFLKAPVVEADALSWTTGIVGWTGIGVPASGYRITYFSDDTGPTVVEVEGSRFNATLLGLRTDTDYFVSVVGIVEEEDGRIFESPQGSNTFGIGAAPGPDVDISSTGLTTARVSWTPSDSSELDEPTGYRVTYYPTNEPEDPQTFDTSETSAAISGLTQGTDYDVQVIALYLDPYEGGSTFESSPGKDSDTTKSLRAPDVTATVTSPTSARIDWNSDIGYQVVSWRIEYKIKGSEEQPMTLEVVGDVTSVDLDRLVRDADYEVSVYGIAEEDEKQYESPPGTDDFVMTTHEAPDVTITETGLHNMQVSWLVRGKYPSQFVGRYYPTNDPDDWKSFTTEDLSYKLTGLDQDTEYTVEITSVYYEGDITVKTDPGSDTDRTKTLRAPDVTTTGLTYTTADIEWTGIGMPADIYIIEYKLADSEDDPFQLRYAGDKTSTTIKNLLHGEEYYVTVVGIVNEDGKQYESPVGSDSFMLSDLVAPVVTITDTSTTTMDIVWETDVDANSFVVVIRGEDGSFNEYTVGGDVREMTFDSLTPGTKYTVSVRTKVRVGGPGPLARDIISPPGRTNGNTKPAPPRNLLNRNDGPEAITVPFDPPRGGFEYFQAKCVPEGAKSEDVEPFEIEKAESLSALCGNVRRGVRYLIYIRTIFGKDPSEWSTLEVTKELGPPQNFDLSEPTTHTIVATWEPPAYVDTVDHYVLAYEPEDKQEPVKQVVISGSKMQFLISELRPSTVYSGSIIAVIGELRTPSASDRERTLDDIVSISVVDSSFNTIEVKWPASTVPGVTYLLSWQASPDFVVERPSGSVEIEPGATTSVIRDLTPASIYDITIEYRYPSDVTADAETSGTTLAPPPGPLSFTNVTETKYVVHWGKPGFNAEPIGYIVTYVGPDPGEIVAQPDGGDTLEQMFDSLKPGITYNVTVIARYQNGIESEPVFGQVTTKETAAPITGQCSCRDYMVRQDYMQNTVEKLVGAIQVLTDRIGDLEKRLRVPEIPLVTQTQEPSAERVHAQNEGSGEEEPTPVYEEYYELLQE